MGDGLYLEGMEIVAPRVAEVTKPGIGPVQIRRHPMVALIVMDPQPSLQAVIRPHAVRSQRSIRTFLEIRC